MQFLRRTCRVCLQIHDRSIGSRVGQFSSQSSAGVGTSTIRHLGSRSRNYLRRWHKLTDSRPQIVDGRRLSSTLYTPLSEADHVPFVLKPEVDFERIFGDLDELKTNVNARGHEVNLEKLVSLWDKLQSLEQEKSCIADRRSKVNKDIKQLNKKGGAKKQKDELQRTGRSLREEFRQINASIASLSDEFFPAALKLPNQLHPAVPHGTSPQVLQTFGAQPEPINTESAEMTANEFLKESHPLAHAGFAYLEHDATLWEMALTHWARQDLLDRGLVPFTCPAMYKPIALEALGLDPDADNETYSIETHDNTIQYLAGIGPLAFIAYHMMSVMETADLPYRSFTVGRSYNSQLESQTFKGLHTSFQTQKVELFGACEKTTTASDALFSQFLAIASGLLSRLPLHYRLVEVPSAHLLPSVYRKCAIEVWIPNIGEFKEVASVSSCTDYLSRRIKMRYPAIATQTAAQSRQRHFLHTVHCTLLDSAVLLAALLPNIHQQFPQVLKPHTPQPITTRQETT